MSALVGEGSCAASCPTETAGQSRVATTALPQAAVLLSTKCSALGLHPPRHPTTPPVGPSDLARGVNSCAPAAAGLACGGQGGDRRRAPLPTRGARRPSYQQPRPSLINWCPGAQEKAQAPAEGAVRNQARSWEDGQVQEQPGPAQANTGLSPGEAWQVPSPGRSSDTIPHTHRYD